MMRAHGIMKKSRPAPQGCTREKERNAMREMRKKRAVAVIEGRGKEVMQT